MSARIRDLIVLGYAFPWRTIERRSPAQHGERKGRWHG